MIDVSYLCLGPIPTGPYLAICQASGYDDAMETLAVALIGTRATIVKTFVIPLVWS